MRTLSPRFSDRVRHASTAALVALVATLASGGTAAAQDEVSARVDRVWIRADSLHVDFTVRELFSDRIRDGLARGLPMTLTYEIELWRDRSGWWDALVARHVYAFKIQQNVWDDRYFIDDTSGRRIWLSNLDALERQVCQRTGVFVTELSGAPDDRAHFVIVVPTLKPLTIQDVREVEAWLTGEIETGSERGGLSVITGLPQTVFGIFIDLAGLGDKSTVARSGRFRLDMRETFARDDNR